MILFLSRFLKYLKHLFYCIQTTKFWKTNRILPIKHARVITERKRGYIPSGEEQVWNEQPMHVPAVIPTTCTSNNPFNYFKVEYKIKVITYLSNINNPISYFSRCSNYF